MAGSVICRYFAVPLAVLAVAGPARAADAEGLRDPTRPAAGIPGSGRPDVDGSSALVLQSVIIMAPGRAYAVINGETVPLGGRIRDARLVKITATEVVLRSSSGTETLRLSPGIELKQSKPADAAPSGKGAAHLSRGGR